MKRINPLMTQECTGEGEFLNGKYTSNVSKVNQTIL